MRRKVNKKSNEEGRMLSSLETTFHFRYSHVRRAVSEDGSTHFFKQSLSVYHSPGHAREIAKDFSKQAINGLVVSRSGDDYGEVSPYDGSSDSSESVSNDRYYGSKLPNKSSPRSLSNEEISRLDEIARKILNAIIFEVSQIENRQELRDLLTLLSFKVVESETQNLVDLSTSQGRSLLPYIRKIEELQSVFKRPLRNFSVREKKQLLVSFFSDEKHLKRCEKALKTLSKSFVTRV